VDPLTRVQMTTLVASGSPLATPCAKTESASTPSGVWLQAAGSKSVDETPKTACRRVILFFIFNASWMPARQAN
jgi:hypothetical protein